MNALRCTIIILLIILVGTAPLHAQKTKYAVIIMMDGARYSETFGDSTHAYIPYMWNELRPQGVVYTRYYNDGKTQTNPGHASVLSGTYQYISNDGSEYSHAPTIFEYIRKQQNRPAADCWVALGKDKLNVLAHSTHAEYGAAFGASVRTSLVPADDQLTMENVKFVLQNHRSRITIANLASTDIDGHAGSWELYTASIRRADSLIAVLWNFIQQDAELKNRTTLIVTNDHGRHTTDFVNHGDGCDGCRHIMLMVLGPDTPKGVTDSTLSGQIDIAPTIGKMMRFNTPHAEGKVIGSAIASAANVPIAFKNAPAGKISGGYAIQWSLGAVKESVVTLVEISGDGGRRWQVISTVFSRDSQFVWNTTEVPDGTRYRMRIQVYGDTTYGFVQSPDPFTVDNPGNGTPDVTLLSPDRNIILSGNTKITWHAADAEGDPVTLSLYASTDNGTTWNTIASSLGNSGSYDWNTSQSANSKSSMIRIIGSDGINLRTVFSPRFEVYNVRPVIPSLQQTGGTGNGIITVNVCAPEQLTGESYTIQFADGFPFGKRYSVLNGSNSIVLSNFRYAGDGSEGPLFDGLRIAVLDHEEPAHNKDSTGWIIGSSTLFTKVLLPEVVLPEGNIQATPEAADYEIRVSDSIVDTSAEYFGAMATPLYFTVYNTSFQRKTPIVLSELSPDGKLSFGDDLYLFRKDSSGKDVLTWEIFMDGEIGSVLPKGGDVYRVTTYKPITGNDRFEFTAAVTSVGDRSSSPGRYFLSGNYPNPFNPSTMIDLAIPEPGFVSITVFDVLGREMRSIVNQHLSAGNYRYELNASSLSSGIYFYRCVATSGNGSVQWVSPVNKMIYLK